MTEEEPAVARFHRERRSAVIAAIAGFLLINSSNFGACAGEVGSRSCLVGDTIVTDEQTLLLVYTPLVFAPIAYLVAALLPKWREALSFTSQVIIVGAGMSLVAAGLVVLRWGAEQAAVVAFVVAVAGVFIGIGSWRTSHREA
ncbi:MAG: hypothetical protein OES13_05000 [Acidimicrobiia bacterium]|nr:hypothetical protein [Acidimicrobiia bacterium]